MLLWTLYLVVAAEVFATYSRLSPHELYHVSGNGRAAGAGRALVFLNWPVALAASREIVRLRASAATIASIGIAAADARSRTISRLAVTAGVLCAAVFWPGM